MRPAAPPRRGAPRTPPTPRALRLRAERTGRLPSRRRSRNEGSASDRPSKGREAEAERIKSEATREIEHERRKAIQDIRTQATDLALLVAEKVVERSLNDADHRRMADEALAAVAKNYPG